MLSFSSSLEEDELLDFNDLDPFPLSLFFLDEDLDLFLFLGELFIEFDLDLFLLEDDLDLFLLLEVTFLSLDVDLDFLFFIEEFFLCPEDLDLDFDELFVESFIYFLLLELDLFLFLEVDLDLVLFLGDLDKLLDFLWLTIIFFPVCSFPYSYPL